MIPFLLLAFYVLETRGPEAFVDWLRAVAILTFVLIAIVALIVLAVILI